MSTLLLWSKIFLHWKIYIKLKLNQSFCFYNLFFLLVQNYEKIRFHNVSAKITSGPFFRKTLHTDKFIRKKKNPWLRQQQQQKSLEFLKKSHPLSPGSRSLCSGDSRLFFIFLSPLFTHFFEVSRGVGELSQVRSRHPLRERTPASFVPITKAPCDFSRRY